MNNAWEDISRVVQEIFGAKTAEAQKIAIERYYTNDVYFKNPVYEIQSEGKSRNALIGVFQWYRILSPQVDVKINGQAFKPFYLPISPMVSRITRREDFFHTDDMMGFFLPFLTPIIGAGMKVNTLVSIMMTKMVQIFGFWRSAEEKQTNGHAKQY